MTILSLHPRPATPASSCSQCSIRAQRGSSSTRLQGWLPQGTFFVIVPIEVAATVLGIDPDYPYDFYVHGPFASEAEAEGRGGAFRRACSRSQGACGSPASGSGEPPIGLLHLAHSNSFFGLTVGPQ